MSPTGLDALIRDVADRLLARDKRLVTAESCTGGLVASHLTGVPGSSDWFEGAFVTYRLSAKEDMLGISPETLIRHTAVSEPVARDMAIGALARSRADVSVSITGVAGPTGGDVIAPVGTVWFGWAVRDTEIACVQTSEHALEGSRDEVRLQAVEISLRGVLNAL